MRLFKHWRWLTLLLLALFVAGCDAPQASVLDVYATPTVEATETGTPTITASPTPRPVSTITGESYMCADPTSTDPSYIRFGDIRVTPVQFAVAYPSVLLPSTTAGKPYKLPADVQTLGGPPVNPDVTEPGGGYGFIICNTSTTASHTIQDVAVKIEQFTAYTDAAATWQFCDGFYQRPTGAMYGGCGGGFNLDVPVHATFAADATTGATVTATPSTSTNLPDGVAPPLPIMLGPGQQLIVNVGLTPPTTAGTYTFGFYLIFDDGQPVQISTMAPTLFDAAATRWTALACTQDELSQISTSDTSGKYVCQEQ
jgi:hypothetical protein